MKRIVCVLFVAVMLFSVCVISTSAAIPTMHLYGDVNVDRKVNISDATEIQLHLAQVSELSLLGVALADVDGDLEVTIADATMIQQKIAKLIKSFNIDSWGLFTDVNISMISSDFDSGKAMAGVPVTFRTDASSPQGAPLSYQYFINDVAVSDKASDSCEFTYSFDEAGTYTIKARVYNKYDEYEEREITYSVVDNENENAFMVSGVHGSNFHLSRMNDIVITAHAYGGVAPYEYKFVLEELEIVQDYSENNNLELGVIDMGEWTVEVYIRDSNGDVVSTSYTFEVQEPLLS